MREQRRILRLSRSIFRCQYAGLNISVGISEAKISQTREPGQRIRVTLRRFHLEREECPHQENDKDNERRRRNQEITPDDDRLLEGSRKRYEDEKSPS